VTRAVNREIAARRVADTEERLLAAATRLFVRDGYAATTLTAVATEAGVAPRTVYVRFGTKAALLKRAVDVAVVGDTAPVSVVERDWLQRARTASTLDDRIRLLARGSSRLMQRAGALFAVAAEAAATEPVIAAAAQSGREVTREMFREFWRAAHKDGLLPAAADVRWLADTSAVLGSADTYVHIARTYAWSTSAYERWLARSWRRLVAAAVVH
jgi:AcrR family transcriptional regulator